MSVPVMKLSEAEAIEILFALEDLHRRLPYESERAPIRDLYFRLQQRYAICGFKVKKFRLAEAYKGVMP